MKTVLVTGASGMLGSAIVDLWQDKYDVYATGNSNFKNNPAKKYKKFDLKNKSYRSLKNWVSPDIIIHAAALTSHEFCAQNPKLANLVNGESVAKLLKTFKNSKIFFISSDAVFPLNTHLATEKTKTNPSTAYGKSKVLGEKYILKSKDAHVIVRTTIVGLNKNKAKESFAERIINTLKRNEKIPLFDNVKFTPITIWRLAEELDFLIDSDKKIPKIIHITGSQISTKFDFGMGLCKILKLNSKLIERAKLEYKPGVIKRSKDQSLNVRLYEKMTGRKLPNLRQTIKDFYDRL